MHRRVWWEAVIIGTAVLVIAFIRPTASSTGLWVMNLNILDINGLMSLLIVVFAMNHYLYHREKRAYVLALAFWLSVVVDFLPHFLQDGSVLQAYPELHLVWLLIDGMVVAAAVTLGLSFSKRHPAPSPTVIVMVIPAAGGLVASILALVLSQGMLPLLLGPASWTLPPLSLAAAALFFWGSYQWAVPRDELGRSVFVTMHIMGVAQLTAFTTPDIAHELMSIGALLGIAARVHLLAAVLADHARLSARLAQVAPLAARAEVILDTMDSAVVAVDENGTVVSVNRAAEALMGLDLASIQGTSCDDLPAPWAHLAQCLQAALADQSGCSHHVFENVISGKTHTMETSSRPVYDRDGRLAGAVAVFRDITAQVELLRQNRHRERLALAGQAAAAAAHEIRNPLSVVKLAARMALDQGTGIGPWLEMIMRNTTQIDLVLDDFLTLSRPAALQRRGIDLAPILDEAVADLTPSEPAAGINRDYQPGLWVYGDPDKLKRVFSNLLRNALEAAGPGGTVTVSARPGPRAVEVEVENDGPPIPEHLLGRIFEPFFTTKKVGTGLGLTISQHIVQDHGGTIKAHNRTDSAGVVFQVCIPSLSAGEVAAGLLPSGTAPNPAPETRLPLRGVAPERQSGADETI